MPDRKRYPEVAHSYILELKYLAAKATQAEADRGWEEAVGQLRHYAQDRKVAVMAQGTQLHLVRMQMQGTELLRVEETRNESTVKK